MKPRLILFGCSHTNTILWKSFDTESCTIVKKSWPGNANSKIINDVYEYVNSSEYEADDILIIQYTYTNRLWWPNKLEGSEFSFHSFDTENSPIYYLNKFAAKELVNLYNTFIKYFWSYDDAFKIQKMNIDFIKSYLEQKNVKFLHWMYTDGGNTMEWNTGYNKFWKNSDSNHVFNKLNLFNIDGEYRIQDWATKNNFVDDTDHVNDEGNFELAKQLCNVINNLFKLKIITKKFG